MKRECKYEAWLPDYVEGTLDEAAKDALEGHLADCSACLETATLLTDITYQDKGFEMEPVPPEFTVSVLTSIFPQTKGGHDALTRLGMKARAMGHLAIDSLRAVFDGPWQLSPARGPDTSNDGAIVHVMKIYRGMAVEIEIEKTGPKTALIRVQLPDPSPKWRNARVTLKRGRREIGSYPFNEGYVVIEEIDFGRYNLLFSRNGTEMGRYHFEIRETHDE